MPTLEYTSNRFELKCTFEDRLLAKNAGMRWDIENKKWYTTEVMVAARLREYAKGLAKDKLRRTVIEITPWSSPLPPPLLKPHQTEAVKFALSRTRSYLGLDPGLGKTACAAKIIHALGLPTVYISPPFLLNNVIAEFERWAPAALSFTRIVPDSMVIRPHVMEDVSEWRHQVPRLLVVDEAHRFKNTSAKRTAALFKLARLFERQVYMSGTPMPNRPMELYSLLSNAAPETIDFMSSFDYGMKYCAGYKNNFGWDFTGASNVSDLARRVIHPSGPFMLRMRKELLKLPPKLEEVFLVSENIAPQIKRLEMVLYDRHKKLEDIIKFQIATKVGMTSDELPVASYRRLIGIEKAKASIEYIKSLLDETDENLLVFAYHKEVISKLTSELGSYKPFVITGETPVHLRQEQVDEYQASKERRLFIGNYLACGVGFTLTKATRVIFVEFSWVPGENAQASDRAHRIGQNSTVFVQYITYKDSIDSSVIGSILNKQRAINQI